MQLNYVTPETTLKSLHTRLIRHAPLGVPDGDAVIGPVPVVAHRNDARFQLAPGETCAGTRHARCWKEIELIKLKRPTNPLTPY